MEADHTPDAALADLLERNLQRVAEALIFAADDPVTMDRIAEVYADVTGEEVPQAEAVGRAVDRLNEAYEETGRTFRIEAWGGGLRLATVASMAPYVQSLFRDVRQKKLSRSLMETVAIVAYRQPVTKPEVDFVRGVDSDYSIRKLGELGLVDVVGRSDSLGRPLLYGTTPRFLDLFGLADLDALPTLREIEEILDDPAFNRERARLLEIQEHDAAAGPSEGQEGGEQDGASGVEP